MEITDALAMLLAEAKWLTNLDAYEAREVRTMIINHVFELRKRRCLRDIEQALSNSARALAANDPTRVFDEIGAIKRAKLRFEEAQMARNGAVSMIEEEYRKTYRHTDDALRVPNVDIEPSGMLFTPPFTDK